MGCVNLDRNASWGVLPEIATELFTRVGEVLNPSSRSGGGQRGRALIEEARAQLRQVLRIGKQFDIVFTSGATEANNIALLQPLLSSGGARGRVVVSPIEHPSVLEPAKKLAENGFELCYLLPNSNSQIGEAELASVISRDTRLLSCMLANNETGHLFDIPSIFAAARKLAPSIVCHCDAVQALGKLELRWDELGADLISISGHKIGALPGIGALLVRKGFDLCPLHSGGPQELRRRAGTENVHGIVSFGIAARKIYEALPDRIVKMKRSKAILWQELSNALPGLRLNSPMIGGLPNTLNITVPGVVADDLVVALDLRNIAISSGAACASGKPEPSHVLRALGRSDEEARASIRLSVSGEESPQDLISVSRCIIDSIQRMRLTREESYVAY